MPPMSAARAYTSSTPRVACQAVLPAAQIEQLELVGRGRRVLRVLEIDAAHPVALLLQMSDQMMADEAAGAGDQNASVCA